MNFFIGLLMAGVGLIGIIMIKSITTIFHELGHAIPSLLFTNGPVNVYVGSYGDTKNSFRIKLSRLTFYLKLNVFTWYAGMCSHQGVKIFYQQLLILLGGPLASITIAIPMVYCLLIKTQDEYMTFFVLVFLVAAIMDLVFNIIPSSRLIDIDDNSSILNDGAQLANLFYHLKLPDKYHTAVDLFANEKTKKAKKLCYELIDEAEKPKKDIYLLIAEIYKTEKDYQKAINVYKNMFLLYPPAASDHKEVAGLFLKENNYYEAIDHLNKYLYEVYMDMDAILMRGEAYISISEYEKASADFSKVIKLDPNNDIAFAYLGHLNCLKREYGIAEIYLSKAIELNTENGLSHYYMGILKEKQGNLIKAHQSYVRAKTLNFQHHGLEYKIESTLIKDY